MVNPIAAFLGILLGLVLALGAAPAILNNVSSAWWVEYPLDAYHVADTEKGQCPLITIRRTVHRDVQVTFTVRIMELVDGEFVLRPPVRVGSVPLRTTDPTVTVIDTTLIWPEALCDDLDGTYVLEISTDLELQFFNPHPIERSSNAFTVGTRRPVGNFMIRRQL